MTCKTSVISQTPKKSCLKSHLYPSSLSPTNLICRESVVSRNYTRNVPHPSNYKYILLPFCLFCIYAARKCSGFTPPSSPLASRIASADSIISPMKSFATPDTTITDEGWMACPNRDVRSFFMMGFGRWLRRYISYRFWVWRGRFERICLFCRVG